MDEMNSGAVAMTENISAPAQEQSAPATPEPANVFGFAPDVPEVAAPEAPADGQDGNVAEGAEGADRDANTGEKTEAAAPAFRDDRRQNAFEAQRKRYQREIETLRGDPAMELGDQLIRDVMSQNRMSREDAVKTIRQRFVDAYAKRENVGQDAARKLMKLQAEEQAREAARPDPEPAPEEQARQIVDDLLAVNVPDGFDMDAAVNDEAFRQLLVEYPAAAAVRIYQAEQRVKQAPQQVADRLRARQSVPASTRPTQSVRPEPNYKEMSSEDFFRMKERVAKNIY